ncbi:phage shock protein PspC (stress-responsive transcriptional regulator) [Paenibacillus amylolyticus]|uniref:Phage shock protein PspC (Stress-responsive transcriptional regulator) n=1 Tax=Paenibacillus amylolyticus TaxID=1451 RepID=A0AAP5H3X6_PAEAM|nr:MULTISPECIES: PspC domain-containing protein [Paenibacillus]MCG7380082.1 PspC domain-containing protein [Paenibacillus sp. ACRSA]MDR6724810.1 phage shock protein PspC (stress-responsive transcriptional regulator) [Paenibacillus amylolyticus]
MSKLYRSTRDRMLTGLCGGISESIGMDSTLLRIIFVISIFVTGGTSLLIYFIAALVVPKEPYPPYDPYGYGAGPGRGYNNYDHQPPRGPYQNNPNQSGHGSFGPGPGYNGRPQSDPRSYDNNGYGAGTHQESDLDSMMKDIEKKALKKEVEELRQKLSRYEKGEK